MKAGLAAQVMPPLMPMGVGICMAWMAAATVCGAVGFSGTSASLRPDMSAGGDAGSMTAASTFGPGCDWSGSSECQQAMLQRLFAVCLPAGLGFVVLNPVLSPRWLSSAARATR